MRIQIKTFLPAIAAAKIGVSQYGDLVVTPTEEEWSSLAEPHRVYLGCMVDGGDKLEVQIPGWTGVLGAVPGEYETSVAMMLKGNTYMTRLVAHDPRVVAYLQEKAEKERLRQEEEKERERIAFDDAFSDLQKMPPYTSYLSSSPIWSHPKAQEYFASHWESIVQEATNRAKEGEWDPGNVFPSYKKLREALIANGTIAYLQERKQERERIASEKHAEKIAKLKEKQTCENEQVDVWAKLYLEGESLQLATYGTERGYHARSFLVDAVNELLREICGGNESNQLSSYREIEDRWDSVTYEQVENPRWRTLQICKQIEETLPKIGLQVVPKGGETPEHTHLQVHGIVKGKNEDNEDFSAVLVELWFPVSDSIFWFVSC